MRCHGYCAPQKGAELVPFEFERRAVGSNEQMKRYQAGLDFILDTDRSSTSVAERHPSLIVAATRSSSSHPSQIGSRDTSWRPGRLR